MRSSEVPVPRLVRRPLEWDLSAVEVLRLVRADALPVALFGTWAGGRDIVASEPLLTRGAPATAHTPQSRASLGGLADVLDVPYPSGAPDSAGPDSAAPDSAGPDQAQHLDRGEVPLQRPPHQAGNRNLARAHG